MHMFCLGFYVLTLIKYILWIAQITTQIQIILTSHNCLILNYSLLIISNKYSVSLIQFIVGVFSDLLHKNE